MERPRVAEQLSGPSDLDIQSDSPTFSWTPRHRTSPILDGGPPSQEQLPLPDAPGTPPTTSARSAPLISPSLLPGKPLSLSGISSRAFVLGQTFGVTTILTLYLLSWQLPLWRAPFFLATLSLFHFLEFWITARYNTRHVNVSSFLLSSNGSAYNLAHTAALAECLVRYLVLTRSSWLPPSAQVPLIGLGLVMIIVGQTTRSLAMVQAGTNFNHTVQTRRREEHQLVTHGVYSHLRHPSYFGFFWWGLGTQLVLGNVVCLVGYALVLWRFFSRRIESKSRLCLEPF